MGSFLYRIGIGTSFFRVKYHQIIKRIKEVDFGKLITATVINTRIGN